MENWSKTLKRMTQWETYERGRGRERGALFNPDFFFQSSLGPKSKNMNRNDREGGNTSEGTLPDRFF